MVVVVLTLPYADCVQWIGQSAMWPRLFDLLLLSVLLCTSTSLFDFTKFLYISTLVIYYHSLRCFLSRFNLLYLGLPFFFSFLISSLFILSAFPLCLPLCCVLLPVWLFVFLFPFSFFVSALLYHVFFVVSFCFSLLTFFRSFTLFYFCLQLLTPSHLTPYSLVGGY